MGLEGNLYIDEKRILFYETFSELILFSCYKNVTVLKRLGVLFTELSLTFVFPSQILEQMD